MYPSHAPVFHTIICSVLDGTRPSGLDLFELHCTLVGHAFSKGILKVARYHPLLAGAGFPCVPSLAPFLASESCRQKYRAAATACVCGNQTTSSTKPQYNSTHPSLDGGVIQYSWPRHSGLQPSALHAAIAQASERLRPGNSYGPRDLLLILSSRVCLVPAERGLRADIPAPLLARSELLSPILHGCRESYNAVIQ